MDKKKSVEVIKRFRDPARRLPSVQWRAIYKELAMKQTLFAALVFARSRQK